MGQDEDGGVLGLSGGAEDLPSPVQVARRRPRRRRPRSRTIAPKHLPRQIRDNKIFVDWPSGLPRPRTWAECQGSSGPCPWVGCKYHLYLDVNPETGSIKINFPDMEPEDLTRPCTLRVTTAGAVTLEETGELMNLTRERVRQIEVRALLKLKMASPSPEEIGAGRKR